MDKCDLVYICILWFLWVISQKGIIRRVAWMFGNFLNFVLKNRALFKQSGHVFLIQNSLFLQTWKRNDFFLTCISLIKILPKPNTQTSLAKFYLNTWENLDGQGLIWGGIIHMTLSSVGALARKLSIDSFNCRRGVTIEQRMCTMWEWS